MPLQEAVIPGGCLLAGGRLSGQALSEISKLRVLMGHASTDTTSVYVHHQRTDLEAAVIAYETGPSVLEAAEPAPSVPVLTLEPAPIEPTPAAGEPVAPSPPTGPAPDTPVP